MDTSTPDVTPLRRYLSLEEKRRIVEETLVEGASVAKIARGHGLNANLVFNWRRLYRKGLLCKRGRAKLLPVRVSDEASAAVHTDLNAASVARLSSAGAIHIQLPGAQVRVEGTVAAKLVRVVLECLKP